MSYISNPGAGPIEGGDVHAARANLDQFLDDLFTEPGQHVTAPARELVKVSELGEPSDGRWPFEVELFGQRVRVDMPGLRLSQVRYERGGHHNPFDFPRLFIDGDSWLWPLALQSAAGALKVGRSAGK